MLDLTANERFVDGIFDLNRCRLIFKIDDREVLPREYSRQDGRAYHDVIDQDWQAGPTSACTRAQAAYAEGKAGAVAHDPDQIGDPAGPPG